MHEVPSIGCVAERPIAAACKAVSHGTRWFESIRTHQPYRASSTGRAAASKAEGASPRPFESDRRVQASLAQRTRAAGFYPAGRPFESVTRLQFTSPIAQMAERLAVNQEVRGSMPRRGASSVCSRVAQWQSTVLIRRGSVDRSHPRVPVSSRCGADGSARDLGSRGRRFETCHRDQHQACAWVWP